MNAKIWGAGLTDVGQKREQNEDSFLCDVPSRLFVIADGMGGRTLGETASKVVVTLFPLMLKEGLHNLLIKTPDGVLDVLEDTLCRLSHELYEQSQKMPALQGLGSTASALFIYSDMAYIAYAGDSRIYLLRDDDLLQVSQDQTTAAALVKLGELTPEVAEHHPLSNALEEYIGKEGQLKPGLRSEQIRMGDRWMLCSDGLTKGVSEDMICELLLHRPTPEDACQALIETANKADGTDNITAIVVDVTNITRHQE